MKPLPTVTHQDIIDFIEGWDLVVSHEVDHLKEQENDTRRVLLPSTSIPEESGG